MIPLPPSPSMSSLTVSPFEAYIFGAFNCHMTVITMILSYRLIKPKWCSLLIGVFAIIKVLSTSFHMRPINQKMRHKRKRSPIHPKGANKPKNFRGCDLMHAFWRQCVTENDYLRSSTYGYLRSLN